MGGAAVMQLQSKSTARHGLTREQTSGEWCTVSCVHRCVDVGTEVHEGPWGCSSTQWALTVPHDSINGGNAFTGLLWPSVGYVSTATVSAFRWSEPRWRPPAHRHLSLPPSRSVNRQPCSITFIQSFPSCSTAKNARSASECHIPASLAKALLCKMR